MIKQCRLCLLLIKISVITTLVFAASEKTAVPLFLFSGQSNMVCLGSEVSGLPSADKSKTYENIKIHNRSDRASKSWSTLKPGFGADANHFGPELYFGKVLSDSMPDTKIAFIKDASSGTYLGNYPNTDTWLPPSSGGPGKLYSNMMTHIDNALKTFNEAFDTSKYTPRWAGFIWLQGEFDGMDQSLANKYETNLTNLIKDIRSRADDDSMPVVIPMISGNSWQYKSTINAAEIAVTTKLVNTDTMNTNGLAFAIDNVHFNAQSMVKIGTTCAQRWLAMNYTKNWWDAVPVVKQLIPSAVTATSGLYSGFKIYDLSGRAAGRVSSSSIQLQRQSSALMLIEAADSKNDRRHMSKVLNLQQ